MGRHSIGAARHSLCATRRAKAPEPQASACADSRAGDGRIHGCRAVLVWTTCLLFLTAPCLTGCTGHATVHSVKLGSRRISATAPLVIEFKPDECYFWMNDDSDLCIAMRSFRLSLRGKPFEREFLLSLVLGPPPADSARDYRADRSTLRFRRDAGFTHTRGTSLGGITGVYDYGAKAIHGRFRITALRQSYWVLTGWRTNARLILLGEFEAVHNEEKGKAILDRTEQGPMGRKHTSRIRGIRTSGSMSCVGCGPAAPLLVRSEDAG